VKQRSGQARRVARVGEDMRSWEHAGQGRPAADFGKPRSPSQTCNQPPPRQ
jgi:hypothetical protein